MIVRGAPFFVSKSSAVRNSLSESLTGLHWPRSQGSILSVNWDTGNAFVATYLLLCLLFVLNLSINTK